MNDEIRRVAYEAAGEMVDDLIRVEEQRAQLAQLRDKDNIILPDDNLNELAALPEDEYARAYQEVRTMYARRERGATLSKALTGGSGAEFYTHVLEHAQQNGCSIAASKAELLGGPPTPPAETPLPKLPPMLNNPYWQALQHRVAMNNHRKITG